MRQFATVMDATVMWSCRRWAACTNLAQRRSLRDRGRGSRMSSVAGRESAERNQCTRTSGVLEAAQMLGIPVVETLHRVPTPIGTDWGKEVVRSRYVTSMAAVSELVRRQM
jgi:hypothetical protein